jgi:hypothetical protein
MARLIPQKQIEEINIFKDSISVNNSVFISGSLLVSQSFVLGSDTNTIQQITGSVEITGSLTLDGPLNLLRRDIRLETTASFADVSLDTRLFGGIKPEDFGANDSTLYVSSTSGDDNNDGRTPQFSLRTVKKAAKIATDGDDGRYGLPTGSLFTGFRIEVAAGTYLEDNPIELPKNTTVWGAGLRVTKILAKNETEDLFWVNSGNYLAEMTFGNLRVFPSVDNSQRGFAVSFAPNAFITTSPYVQNCSMISNQENSFLEAYEPIPPGGGGLNVDGNRIHPDSPLASMVLDAYTQVAPNGVGCQVVGRGFIQLVSFFTNFSAYSVKVLDGGQAVLLNSNTSFGNFGMFASGSRFITGSGGNQDAFLNVQDNYSIIVNTIEQGLDAIPSIVPNTNNRIRATDPIVYPQYFVSEDSSVQVADIVKSDFNLINSIIETADSYTPSLIAKSSTKGYGPNSVYNISGIEQVLSETTASLEDIDKVNVNFNILLDIIARGNAATESLVKVSNVSESIQVSDNIQSKNGVTDAYYQDISDTRFNTIISIVERGLSATPIISSNVSSSFVVSDDLFYQTDITASASTINSVSASFALVYNIVENGTGSLPTTILSSSVENPSIEVQNAYTLLIENIPFIQSETITYLSSSWSEFEYNEASCSRDIGFIVSGVAHDLLYGGNEESLRSGIFYYEFPSEATSVQLDPTLTGIKYASGLVRNILSGNEFIEVTPESLIAYDNIINNKQFIRDEVISYISSSWSEFEYSEEKCRRDVGYILDAVATDIVYGGNERSVIAGQFYYKYPSLAIVDNRTVGQLQQTLDALKYTKRITKKLLNNDTFITASESRIGAVNLMRENRQLIQDETIIYINTEYPNFDYNQSKCKRDVGYIVDNIVTDLLYGGNERTEIAGFYYFLYPSIANTTQLRETLQAIRYVNGISNEIIQSNLLETPRIISNIDGNIRVTTFQPIITSSISATDSEVKIVSQSYGIIEDVIRHGTDSILASIGSNSDDFNWTLETPINVTYRTQVTSSAAINTSVTESISENIDTIINIIQSGSSITTEETIGTDSKGNPISTVGIPKNSYGDNLVTTVIGTLLPNNVSVISNTNSGIKVNNDVQYTASLSASNAEITKVSSSFSIITDIIKYGISGSLEISGSSDASTYFEVVTLDGTPNAFYINKSQIQKFDDSDGKFLGEDTGSFEDSVQDPTLTLKRGELYTFSINNLKIERATPSQLQPFYIKTERVGGTSKQYNTGVTNNGISFGTIAFIVPFDAPDTLFYVNGNNVSASGVFNIVDNLPLADTQRYVEIPSIGSVEVVTNTVDNIKISTLEQYTSSLNATTTQSLNISSSFSTIINILEEGLGGIPTLISNTSGSIKFTTISQFTGSLSGSLEDIDFISSSISIVTNIIEFGSGSYETASNYVSISTEPSTLAAYEIIKENIPFIQSETIAYLSSSWSDFEYNEASCSRDIGLIISGAAEDLLWGVPSASIVNGKYYFEFPSQATDSQLNQTLDGVNYASRLAQKLVQNIVYTPVSLDVIDIYDLLTRNKSLIQTEVITYISSSWSGFEYNESKCRRDVGFIIDAVATDFIYGGNERSVNAGEFYYLYPSEATGSQLTQTVDGITYAQRLTDKIINNVILQNPSDERTTTYNLLFNNKQLIQNEVITYISSSWSGFEYIETKCRRDVGFIIDAVGTDVLYGGNERSIKAGEFYYLYPSEATTTQSDQTITGVLHAKGLSEKLIQNIELIQPDENTVSAYNVILSNKEFIQDNVIEYIDIEYPYFTYNRTKCRRDVGFIVDAIATDLLWGGNERSVIAGDYYYRFPSQATTGQLRETTEAIEYINSIVKNLISDIILPTPRIITNVENNIKFTDGVQYTGSLSLDTELVSTISSSYGTVNDVILNGLNALPILVKNTEDLIKVTDTPQVKLEVSGSQTEVGIISSSIDMINDIIRLGSSSIPFAIAKHFDTTLDVPQKLTTGNYVAASGNFTEVDIQTELENVSASFNTINTIISSGTGSIPQVVSNVASNIKVSGTEQYTLNTSGSQTEVSIVSASVDIIERIVQNGLSVIPSVIENNTNINNLIKVGNVTQSLSVSGADRLQSKIVSASFGLVIDIITNGTGSLPILKEYITRVDAPKTVLAYELLKENIPFIQEETILFMSSSWSGFMYDEEKCRRDIGFIVSGSAEDLIFNANSASIVNGKFYFEFPSEATGSQLDQTLTAIRYASNLAQNIVRNREYVTASLEVSSSYQLLVQNKQFVKDETIEFISSSWSNFLYNQETCKRDVGFIIDAVATDLLYGGNERSVTAGRYYYDYPSAAIVGGIPSETQQKDPTVTAINYVKGILSELVDGEVFVTTSAEVEYVYDSLRLNRGFIQNETIAFVNAKYPNLQYNEASCSRDTGFIVDAVATDLRWGGNQRSATAGEFYYRFPSIATSVQLGETTDAIVYASDLVREIILQNELFVPTASLNTDFNIKTTLTPQITGSGTSNINILSNISASFGLVMDIIVNGTGSLPVLVDYTASLTDVDTLNAYNIVKSNIPFIQSEVIAYISSSWSGFEYNEASCSRDTGFIVSGAIEDLLFNANSASIVNGKYYFEFPSAATGSQLEQTLDGIRYAAGITNKIIQGVTLEFPSTEASASWELLRRNKSFIQSESIAYISSSWSTFSYNQETCKRDVGFIIDAVATDIKYGGTQRSVTAGDFYYRYPSNATTSELEPTTTGIKYAGNLGEKIILNETFVTASDEKLIGNQILLQNRAFIQSEVIAYISSSWSDFEYNEASCSRDTGFIVDAVATDLLYGGNERSRTAGEYYYIFPSTATTIQVYPTTDGVKYASGISQKLVQNIEFITASLEVSASWHLLRDNKQFIQDEVIEYVSSSWSGVYYNESKCRRDVGYLIDAVATDIYYGGNERSVTAGSFYYLFPSRATNKGVPSEQNQLDPTIDGINYAKGLSQKVIQNTEFIQPSASVLVGADLLIGNRQLIQREVITFLSSSWSEFEYNEASCSRDVGYIIDAVKTDLVYGGNERSIQAGRFYYYIPSVATSEQKPQTIDGINFAKGLSEKVILKTQLIRPTFDTRVSVELLKSRKKDLQTKAISYTNGAFPGFVYNEEKCYRDTGFIVDAIATDLFYGGNERSVRAASSYYTGVYGSAAVVVNEQKLETAETNRYLRTQFQRIVRNSPLELFGSLIITTGHDFSYAGAGVTYKALPPNQGGAGVPDPTKEIVELDGGRVFFTAGNELGDFKIGTGLIINQATGTLQGRTFSRSLFSLVTPFSLALEG